MRWLEINQIWVHHDPNRKRNWDKDDVVQKYNGKDITKQCNNVICSHMDGLKIIMSGSESDETNLISLIYGIFKKKKDTNELLN